MLPLRNALNESLAPDSPVKLRDRWYELTEDYCYRSLTKEPDKLPAFVGLAENFQSLFPDERYLAGM